MLIQSLWNENVKHYYQFELSHGIYDTFYNSNKINDSSLKYSFPFFVLFIE